MKFLYVGDLHQDELTPIHRIDDFNETRKEKISEILKIAKDNNVSKEKAKLNTKDFLKLDYNVKHLNERLNLITDLLESDIDECGRNHFESYFDDFYRANINTDKPLSDKLFE